jgi:hypothetical protein
LDGGIGAHGGDIVGDGGNRGPQAGERVAGDLGARLGAS